MQGLGILFEILINVIIKTFPKLLFSSALRMEQYPAPFVEPLVLNLLSGITRQKCNA